MTDSEEFLTALRRITHAADLQSKRLLKQTGLTAPQLLILHVLQRNGALSAGALAREMALSQATITSMLVRLEAAGFVRRDRGRSDRRLVYVSLTPAGQRKLLSAPELMNADYMQRFRAMADWERTMVLSALQRVAAIMAPEPGMVPDTVPALGPAAAGDITATDLTRLENPILVSQVNMDEA